MPGQKKLSITTSWSDYGSYQSREELYTCDYYELRGPWVILHNAFHAGDQHKTLSLSNVTRIEER